MQIYFRELSLEDGFEVLKQQKQSRLVGGRCVSACSGWKLFQSLEGAPIRCWECGVVADRWVAEKGKNDHQSKPVLNLYASVENRIVMMTRDHIIPKSLGGTDDVENLRPGCDTCNSSRGNALTPSDLQFRIDNPHLISELRLEKGKVNAIKAAQLAQNHCAGQVDKILAPFQTINEL